MLNEYGKGSLWNRKEVSIFTNISKDKLIEAGSRFRAMYLVEQAGYTLGVAVVDLSDPISEVDAEGRLINYIQQDRTTLMMNYDPAKENPMVTRQGGTLKGEVSLNNGEGFGANHWAGNVEINKPVSRPWIEWMKDELIDTEATESASKTEETVTGISNYQGPRFVAVNQPRNITFKYTDMNPYDKNGTFIYPAKLHILPNTGDVEITPVSPLENGAIKLKWPVESNVKIKVNGLSESQHKTDVLIIVQLPDGRQKLIDTFPISVFNAGMAVDYNRDGEITFDDSDKPTAEKPYEFWVNNDLDLNDPLFGAEKDLPLPLPNVYADCTDQWIMVKRDLEDFARLWIQTGKENLGAKVDELTYGLHFSGNSSAKAHLFSAVEPDGGLKYLQDPAIAERQISKSDDTHFVCDINPAGYGESSKWGLFSCKGGDIDYYIFEGVNVGYGEMVLEVMDGAICVGRYKLPIFLRDIKDFYDFYSVGNDPDESPDLFYSTKRSHSQDIDFKNEYLLFVHGWNWPEWEEIAYAETMYKRLWWLGYKGHFGMFQWPANYAVPWNGSCEGPLCIQNFDLSEYNAWNSGQGLAGLLTNLHNDYEGNVNVISHSQGAVVVSEGLRSSIENNPSIQPVVKGYLSLQGAISASYYDSNALIYDYDNRNVANGVLVDNPNTASYFPTGEQSSSPDPYFNNLISSQIKFVNFYNPEDYAITVGVWAITDRINWKWDNNSRPDVLYDYDTELKQYYHLVPATDPRLPMNREYLDFIIPSQRFTIFSYAAEAYGMAIGATNINSIIPERNVNLSLPPYSLTNSWPDHDAEFLDDMAKRWQIWSNALYKLNVSFNDNIWPYEP